MNADAFNRTRNAIMQFLCYGSPLTAAELMTALSVNDTTRNRFWQCINQLLELCIVRESDGKATTYSLTAGPRHFNLVSLDPTDNRKRDALPPYYTSVSFVTVDGKGHVGYSAMLRVPLPPGPDRYKDLPVFVEDSDLELPGQVYTIYDVTEWTERERQNTWVVAPCDRPSAWSIIKNPLGT